MSRASQKEERRLALIEGAVLVLVEHGIEGFTTGRIAKAAGITQSGFYKHFADRDACLDASAHHVGEQVLGAIRQARLAGGSDPSQLIGMFGGALQALLERREACELFLRYRRDPGLVGDVFRGLVERGVDELHTDLLSLGLFAPENPVVRRMSRYCVVMTLGAVEALFDGHLTDSTVVATDLARIATSVLSMEIS